MAANRIAIFGGSFNPVHNGHVGIVKRALARFAPCRVLVVPAATSPFKMLARDALPDALRLAMVRAAFDGMENVETDGREIERGGVSFAIDTVGEIAAENPGAELIFLVGEDAMEGVPMWKDAGELRRLCRFEAFARTRESSSGIRRRLAAGDAGAFDDMPPAAARLLAEYLDMDGKGK